MKIREGFVSNSSSTSFIITNKTKETLPLVEFVRENIFLVAEYNKEYGADYTDETVIKSVIGDKELLKPGRNYCTFGDEDGTVIGRIYDYILRDGGNSERFSWRFEEYNR